jgi:chloramphenicol 3-O-phosphotransferase
VVTSPHSDCSPCPGRAVVVVGLMGAGKTTLAEALARRWARPLCDSDADLLAEHGRNAAQLAAELGADGLHDLEAAHLVHRRLVPIQRANPQPAMSQPKAARYSARAPSSPAPDSGTVRRPQQDDCAGALLRVRWLLRDGQRAGRKENVASRAGAVNTR